MCTKSMRAIIVIDLVFLEDVTLKSEVRNRFRSFGVAARRVGCERLSVWLVANDFLSFRGPKPLPKWFMAKRSLS